MLMTKKDFEVKESL